MTLSLADKARANRRAALASLNARFAEGENVVSIFDRVISRRQSVPEFHTTRSLDALVAQADPALASSNPQAA